MWLAAYSIIHYISRHVSTNEDGDDIVHSDMENTRVKGTTEDVSTIDGEICSNHKAGQAKKELYNLARACLEVRKRISSIEILYKMPISFQNGLNASKARICNVVRASSYRRKDMKGVEKDTCIATIPYYEKRPKTKRKNMLRAYYHLSNTSA